MAVGVPGVIERMGAGVDGIGEDSGRVSGGCGGVSCCGCGGGGGG